MVALAVPDDGFDFGTLSEQPVLLFLSVCRVGGFLDAMYDDLRVMLQVKGGAKDDGGEL